jgi:hypothetical protein
MSEYDGESKKERGPIVVPSEAVSWLFKRGVYSPILSGSGAVRTAIRRAAEAVPGGEAQAEAGAEETA